jgi:hypothetical protein
VAVPDESLRELTALSGVLAQEDLHSTLAEICRIAVRAVPAGGLRDDTPVWITGCSNARRR